jgi:tetratricopeptide (TPR) repeat protein
MISNHPQYISGRQKFEAHDFEGALTDYNQVLEAEENPNVYSERGVVYYYLKQLDLSLADMDHAAELEPENPYRYASRAYIKDAMGDTEGAIADYEEAIRLDPDDSIAHNNLGLLLEKLGYKDKAKENYQRADQLAEVDKLLNRIRKEHRQELGAAPEAGPVEPHVTQVTEERSTQSVLTLLRQTFTTRNGWREYIQFIRNGFK